MAAADLHSRTEHVHFQMDGDPKGLVYIINNHFTGQGHLERTGSEKDIQALERMHDEIGRCKVVKRTNLKAAEIYSELKELAESKRKAAFYAIFVMSHGDSESDGKKTLDMVIANDNKRVEVTTLIRLFKVPHLKDIPILLFFQICRGTKVDSLPKKEPVKRVECFDSPAGEPVRRVECFDSLGGDKLDELLLNQLLKAFPDGNVIGINKGDERTDAYPCDRSSEPMQGNVENADTSSTYEIPNMLVSFAAVQGYYSIRHVEKGTWFIQEICDAFRKHSGEKDVVKIMNVVHDAIDDMRSVAYPRARFAARTSHTLEKELYFFPGL